MTTLLTRLVSILERGVDALERIADATESIAAMTVFHESGHDVDTMEKRWPDART